TCTLFLVGLRSPRLPHIPYTTLFRSRGCGDGGLFFRAPDQNETVVIDGLPFMIMSLEGESLLIVRGIGEKSPPRVSIPARFSPRSEEHTSELQSRENLVCRLLLEKKN